MSNYAIIQNTTVELRRRIHEALVSIPDADIGFTNPETDITLTLPNNEGAGAARLSVYLYHIEPDGHLRNQHALPVGDAGLRFPPIPILLRYLITPLGEDEGQNHLMLGGILQHFHDRPFIQTVANQPLDDSFGGNSGEMRITFEPLTMEQISQIWGALNTDYRLSIAYTVRIVTIDSAQGLAKANRVREMQTGFGYKGS